ncbi:uncharacterized protein BYT42DRAFT_395923 [Radiomyces spectabilis]|uniref:uncharacterized protein n=1 Tax=Radiomyces spectabilis TaxID=64574 RepID=UPI00221F32A5|nr:uncharacterized protein BYT42DRAFT_395923 [Radiomyces spectabilis]KAI8374231.1 hypothetical protein BYT42DRAFT_395923 [Radiomyces spectabilis]
MSQLTEENIAEFHRLGYTILRNALTPEELHALHEEADMLMNYLMSEDIDIVRDLGCIIEPLTCGYLDPPRSRDYTYKTDAYMERRNSILDQSMASQVTLCSIARSASKLLGSSCVYLLNEQYIVKPPATASKSQFAWHRDSDYYADAALQDEPTVACWTTLDPVDADNGSIALSAFGSTGPSITQVVEAPAGSIVFMSNKLFHKSTGNATSKFRRVFMPQYSARPLLETNTSRCVALAVPCEI